MQDIDFDELDRAVSSVTNPPKAAIPDSTGESVTVKTVPPAPATPPAAKRTSGRFMDVVHPSSDMRSSSHERSEPRPPEPATPVRSTEWPDPLDFHGFTGNELDEPKEEAPASTPEEDAATPLETPFLSNTKVEKRPLGAFSAEGSVAPELPPVPPKEEEPLLEAPEPEALLAAEPEKEATVPEVKPEPAPEVTPEPAPAPVEDVPTGPTSITQQYKEHPSTTEQPSSAIYDTEATHLPLTHTKKKSGALVVVWIIALIVVGGGVGAAVYYFVLPNL